MKDNFFVNTLFLMLTFKCFQAKGACIGDVFLASEVAFHDRRIPIPVSNAITRTLIKVGRELIA